MIRGAHKNVIVIKNTENDVFEEAIFIVNPKRKIESERFLRKEARKIIEEKTDFFTRKKGLFK